MEAPLAAITAPGYILDASLLVLHTWIWAVYSILRGRFNQAPSDLTPSVFDLPSSSLSTDVRWGLSLGFGWEIQRLALKPLECCFDCMLRAVVMLKGELLHSGGGFLPVFDCVHPSNNCYQCSCPCCWENITTESCCHHHVSPAGWLICSASFHSACCQTRESFSTRWVLYTVILLLLNSSFPLATLQLKPDLCSAVEKSFQQVLPSLHKTFGALLKRLVLSYLPNQSPSFPDACPVWPDSQI